jgi:hypothetical protein
MPSRTKAVLSKHAMPIAPIATSLEPQHFVEFSGVPLAAEVETVLKDPGGPVRLESATRPI